MCDTVEIITSEPENSSSIGVNTAIVMSIINTGQGYGQLEQISGILNMPNMSNKKYQKEHEVVERLTGETAWDAMKDAAQEEVKIAIENGDVNDEGIPLITVIADGAWSKRSYKTNYNALSGVVSNKYILLYLHIILITDKIKS